MRRFLLSGVLVASLGVTLPAAAESEITAERAGSLAASCAACHGTSGRLDAGIPPLAGQAEAVLRAQLLAFRRDATPGATVMPRLAKGYSEEELKAIAAYFAALDPDEE